MIGHVLFPLASPPRTSHRASPGRPSRPRRRGVCRGAG
jgi:hypothetical protein